jgi:DNA repair exonuclease SbcCD nuclease subunit
MNIEYLGDCHLGKKFENGVPLHRRGDRERMQREKFRRSLLDTQADLHIQVGDLLDKMMVPYSVIWAAYQDYREAVLKNPDTTYVVLRGNHDASRDADKISAFQIFTNMVRPFGVVVVDDEPVRFEGVVAIPWHPFINAAEMVTKYADMIRDADVVVGHYDVVMGDDNQMPARMLKELGVKRAVTGHDHNKRELMLDGLPVEVTGSMQPYSHGEDPDGELYVTIELSRASEDWTNHCVRLVLQPNEEAPAIDCLQLQTQRVKEQIDIGQVEFEAFDLNELYVQACREVGLDEGMSALTLQKLEETRAAQQG